MPKQYFYISRGSCKLTDLASYLYKGENAGFYRDFVDINSNICTDGITQLGQTLYVPSTQFDCNQHREQIINTMRSINESDSKLTSSEKKCKAMNHSLLVLGLDGGTVAGVSSGFFDYRLGRISSILSRHNDWLQNHFKTHGNNFNMKAVADQARSTKTALSVETDGIIGFGKSGIGHNINVTYHVLICATHQIIPC